jgi:aldehyde dehydrogenase (NAD+)
MLVAGQRVSAASGATFPSTNPATGEPWAQIPDAGAEDVDAAVRAARAALTGPWGTMTAAERGERLHAVAALLDEHADELAVLESRDNGKILRETTGQMRAMPRWFRFFGGLADKVEGTVPQSGFPTVLNYVVREPLGVVAAVVPWNSSLMLTAWKLAPALAGGNTVVVKPSEYTSASLLEAARLFEEAGLPPGVVNVVTGAGPATGRELVAHPGVDHISFTGGPATARAISRAAAEHLTPMILELGGKSAQVVFADADLDLAVPGVLAGIFAATGQTCIAGSRLLVERSVHDELVEALVERAASSASGTRSSPTPRWVP